MTYNWTLVVSFLTNLIFNDINEGYFPDATSCFMSNKLEESRGFQIFCTPIFLALQSGELTGEKTCFAFGESCGNKLLKSNRHIKCSPHKRLYSRNNQTEA
jgi:hypothetical protein